MKLLVMPSVRLSTWKRFFWAVCFERMSPKTTKSWVSPSWDATSDVAFPFARQLVWRAGSYAMKP